MTIPFDLDRPQAIEFGVGRDAGDGRSFGLVSVRNDVQAELSSMAKETLRQIEQVEGPPVPYDPASTPSAFEYLQLPIHDVMASEIQAIFDIPAFDRDALFPNDLSDVFCYFALFTGQDGSRLLCLRRAAQFKSLAKKKAAALRGDALQLVPEPLFQLNNEFDVIVDHEMIHIIHPKSFSTLAQIDLADAETVSKNVKAIREHCPYVQWSNIEEHAISRPSIARLLASIRSSGHAENVDRRLLVRACIRAEVPVQDGEQIAVPDNDIKAFLEVLNRRLYEVDLVPSHPEFYVASNRRQLGR